ncbi:hypothetical protein QJS10_CPB17g01407 [Acorus calamus]|uniref:Uncharacterized protein n=1 Tax=Acorus calamus TaxID=4465 RepID=A0AAV9CXY8_ACOCL|nr:hypothetical protein QJS10_CPB17g01407 [Acorus calamus]
MLFTTFKTRCVGWWFRLASGRFESQGMQWCSEANISTWRIFGIPRRALSRTGVNSSWALVQSNYRKGGALLQLMNGRHSALVHEKGMPRTFKSSSSRDRLLRPLGLRIQEVVGKNTQLPRKILSLPPKNLLELIPLAPLRHRVTPPPPPPASDVVSRHLLSLKSRPPRRGSALLTKTTRRGGESIANKIGIGVVNPSIAILSNPSST